MKVTLSLALLVLLAAPTLVRADEGVAPVSSSDRKVTPGKVHWHRSLADAIVAAEKTKKPVLHFQLLGDLDQEFC